MNINTYDYSVNAVVPAKITWEVETPDPAPSDPEPEDDDGE